MISLPTLLDWPVSNEFKSSFPVTYNVFGFFLAKEQANDIEHLVDHFTNLHLGGMCFIS